MKIRKILTAVLALTMVLVLSAAAFAATFLYTTGSVNLREGPSLSFKSKTQLKSGTKLAKGGEAYDERGVKWYLVKTAKGTVGYVSSKYIAETPQGKGGTITMKSGASNIRKSPSIDAKSIGVMPKGASAKYSDTAVEWRDGYKKVMWYKISYKGVTGWVSERYTK